jgi:oxaloacetate decarboxylase alpha subunit
MGRKRYANVPDEIIRYVAGRFGRPTRPVDPTILEQILARPRAAALMKEPPPPTLAELRRQFGAAMDDEELLLRAVMPSAQVDAMLAAGPARQHYNPELAPVLALLRGLSRRDVPDELVVDKPGFRLALRRVAREHA